MFPPQVVRSSPSSTTALRPSPATARPTFPIPAPSHSRAPHHRVLPASSLPPAAPPPPPPPPRPVAVGHLRPPPPFHLGGWDQPGSALANRLPSPSAPTCNGSCTTGGPCYKGRQGNQFREPGSSDCLVAAIPDWMDKVTEEVVDLKKEWDQTVTQLEECIAAFKSCGSTGIGTQEAHSLPRLNRAAKDGMQLLKTMQFRLDFLAQQLPTFEEVQSAQATLESWEQQQKMLRASLNNAKFQAKENITKAAREERELLLGCGEESTLRRRNLQTKAEMTSAAQSVTESLRRSRQLMIQEVERSASTLETFDVSTTVLCKAEVEYQGHRSLLIHTRGLLSTMQRQDVLDRIIFVIGSVLFSLAVLYVVSKRIGLLPLQRRLTNAVRSLSVSAEDVVVAQHGAPVHAHDL